MLAMTPKMPFVRVGNMMQNRLLKYSLLSLLPEHGSTFSRDRIGFSMLLSGSLYKLTRERKTAEISAAADFFKLKIWLKSIYYKDITLYFGCASYVTNNIFQTQYERNIDKKN